LIRLDEGIIEEDLSQYIKDTFNIFFIDNGTFPHRFSA
jgi:hypothetical protein